MGKRIHCVSVRVSIDELATIDVRRGGMRRGAWLRVAALNSAPPSIPKLNQRAWVALARASANLNQISHKLNISGNENKIEIEEIKKALFEFRGVLIGANFDE